MMLSLWTTMSYGAWGIFWVAWSTLQCTLVPTQAFVLLSSYPALSRQYDVGTVYEYKYETSVLLNEPQLKPVSTSKDVGFRLKLRAEVTAIWQHPSSNKEQLLQVNVLSPKLSVKSRQGPTPEGFVDKGSRVDSFRNNPLFILYSGGRITKVFSVSGEDISSVNLKKGIASLLQVQIKQGVQEELDTSGLCQVKYVVGDPNKIVKFKNNCQPKTDSSFYKHINKVLGAAISSSSSTSYELRPADKVVLKADSLETHFLKVEARKSSASEVISRQTLEMTGTRQSSIVSIQGSTEFEVIKDLAKKTRLDLVTDDLHGQEENKECIACKTLQELVSSFKTTLKSSNLGTQSSALAFIRILRKMRESSVRDIKAVMSSKKNAKILAQLLDIVASTQTAASHKAALSFVNFREEKKIILPERFLLALSLSTHPSAHSIQDYFEMMKRGLNNKNLQETLVYTVASLVKTYSKMQTQHSHKPLVEEISKYFQEQLDRCSSTNCMVLYVSALKTLQQQSSLPQLLSLVKKAPKKAATTAMRAIQTMPLEYIDSSILKELERIFLDLDRKHDSSVKIMAADLLLQYNPSQELLKSMLRELPDQKNKEVNTALLSRVHDLLEKGNRSLLSAYKNVTKLQEFGNYNVLGQNGLSSAFSRPLTANSEDTANSSFTNILEISKGLLKRSNVDVFVNNNEDSLRILSFGSFAGGLDVFGGGAEGEGEATETEEANAGIEITLMDTQLRPFVFFTSKSELMGHVWSGTASERTTALQGSALLQDHQQRIPLQNGFSVEMLLTGSMSYDFAGQVQISLWSQNAHSLVEIGAGMVIQGQARVDTSFVQTMIEFNTGVQTRMDFTSDLEFSGSIAMCMQMSQPDYEVVENVRKLERIPGSKYILRKYKRKLIPGPGKTYVINKKNTSLCTKMFA